MNEKAKFAACLAAGVAVTGGVWTAAALPFSGPYPAWFVVGALALAVLAHTFEVSRRNLQRTAGVVLLLVGLFIVLGRSSDAAFARGSVLSILNRHGELGIVTLGAGLLILTGGIDLSVGSLVALSAVSFGLLAERGVPPAAAAAVVLFGGVILGIGHGLLVTQLGLQAFLVTLCGMFIYRGVARSIQPGQIGRGSVKNELEKTVGEYGSAAFESQFLDLRYWLTGQNADERLVFPALLVLFLLLAAIAAVFLHRSSFGRYWYAIGHNEQAAKYAGVTVWKHKVAVFAICSGLAALAGVIRFLSAGSVTPSVEGDSYELYAITAAVLGGVSLRGGEGTAVGLVCGALVLPVVKPVMNFTKCPSEWEPWLIGLILLAGAIVDETIRRRGKRVG